MFHFEKKLGFGFMRLPYIWSEGAGKEIDFESVCKMVDYFIDQGYAYFDTAKPYLLGKSQNYFCDCVAKRHKRERFLLANKLPNNMPIDADLDSFFEEQLKDCGVNYFDFYLLHNVGRVVYEAYNKREIFDFLVNLKKKGKVRYIGFSFHDSADILENILKEHPEVDFVQLQLNYLDWNNPKIQSKACYEVARKYGKSIFVMEPLKGGAIANIPFECKKILQDELPGMSPAELGFKFVASLEGVKMILSGMSAISQVENNIDIFNRICTIGSEEQSVIDKIVDIYNKQKQIQCSACRYCEERCPVGIHISEMFALYNSYHSAYKEDMIALGRHKTMYKEMQGERPNKCVSCGRCENVCPQHLPVREHIREVADCFEETKNMYTVEKNVQIVIALLKKHNIRHLVLSPGARNVPFVHSVENDSFFKCYSYVDERGAAHFAMGMAQELQEPVLISCTSSTACCNYLPAITEAYYHGVPLVVLTSDRDPRREGQMEDLMIHQNGMYRDVCRKYVQLPTVNTSEDFVYCERLVNEALLELQHHGSGPVHINMPVYTNLSKFTDTLPEVRKICRHEIDKNEEEWNAQKVILESARKVMVIYGQTDTVSNDEVQLLERFVEKYNGVVIAEHMANVESEYVLNPYLLFEAMTPQCFPEELMPDLIITLGGRVSSKLKSLLRAHSNKFKHWRVNEDGDVVDVFNTLTDVFECSSLYFLKFFTEERNIIDLSYYNIWQEYMKKIIFPKLPFSNVSTICKVMERIPEESNLHLSVLNNIRIAQYFPRKQNVRVYANLGACGIEGAVSTFLGQASVTSRLSFLFVGDLSFFYDMNAVWNRYIRGNVRILMINNGGGAEFHLNFGTIMPDTVDQFVAASHDSSAKAWVESQGFIYISAKNEVELMDNLPRFVAEDSKAPIFFEVFTDRKIDGAIVRKIYEINRSEILATKKTAEYKAVTADQKISINYPQYPFPYDKLIGLGKKIVIYGAGNVGKIYYRQVAQNENCELVAWIDKNADKLVSLGMPVKPVSFLAEAEYDALVIAIKDSNVVEQVKKMLLEQGVAENKIVWSICELWT